MDNIPRDWLIVFASVGILASGFVSVIYVASLFVMIKEKIIFLFRRYQDKHFLKHPPKIKCYCIQCDNWVAEVRERTCGYCTIFEKWTNAGEACSRGTLRTEQQYKNEEYRMETK